MKKLIFAAFSFLPAFGFAEGITEVNKLVNNISTFILKPLMFLMFALATLVFIWGVQGFVTSADDPEARGKGARQMIWGIVGMTVMIAAAALVTIIKNTATTL
ncbi:MAG: hypothetical protein HYV67_01895 [Candidatus Taylorbacteria bacterium]|nr:hypothetical protein [Candidatus Taylorbacteria bacterium]